MPRCTNRESGPIFSASQVRNAITSCRVSASIASIRARSASENAAIAASPCVRIAAAASAGTSPVRTIASAASASISNQIR